MHQAFNFGGEGWSFGVLAAGLIFAFGLWQGRHDLARRAATDVLLATILTSLVVTLPAFWVTTGTSLRLTPLFAVVWAAVSILLNFVPLAVAARWMDYIRRAGAEDVKGLEPQPAPSLGPVGQVVVVLVLLALGFTLLRLTR